MRTVRNCVFETNSSSCHVITVLSDNELALLKNGELLLSVHKSKGDKVLTKSYDEWSFEQEVQHCKFCFDYEKGEKKYVSIKNDIIESLSKNLWNLLTQNTTAPVEDFDQKLDNIFDMYELDESFVTEVRYFIKSIEDSSSVQFLLKDMMKYNSRYDYMNFSSHAVEC